MFPSSGHHGGFGSGYGAGGYGHRGFGHHHHYGLFGGGNFLAVLAWSTIMERGRRMRRRRAKRAEHKHQVVLHQQHIQQRVTAFHAPKAVAARRKADLADARALKYLQKLGW